jgi:hypothetical protein
LPTNPALRLVAEFLLRNIEASALSRSVDREKMILMAFPISSGAKTLLKDILPVRQPLNGSVGAITHGNFDSLDVHMFAPLRGKTLVVVGHIVEIDSNSSFEIRRDDGERRYLPLAAQQKASLEVGFNLIPLGCETGEALAVGTASKITDVDGLNAFQRATSSLGQASYLQILTDLSDAHLRILIDPAKFESGNLVPIELIDEDGQPCCQRIGDFSPSSAGTKEVTAPRQTPQLRIISSDWGKITCDVSATALARSYSFKKMLLPIRVYWLYMLGLLLLIFCIVGSIEWIRLLLKLRAAGRTSESSQDNIPAESTMLTLSRGTVLFILLGVVSSIYAYLAYPFGRNLLDHSQPVLLLTNPFEIGLFILSCTIVVATLAEYKMYERLKKVNELSQIAIVMIWLLSLLENWKETIFFSYSAAFMTAFVLAPFLAFRIASALNCLVTAKIALSVSAIPVFLIVINWIQLVAYRSCLLVDPYPL